MDLIVGLLCRILRVRLISYAPFFQSASLVFVGPRIFSLLTFTQHYEHLFKMNSARSSTTTASPHTHTQTGAAAGRGKQTTIPTHSHYLQSKVVRAKERIEAEMKVAEEEGLGGDAGPEGGSGGS